jgi:hypothetical protein
VYLRSTLCVQEVRHGFVERSNRPGEERAGTRAEGAREGGRPFRRWRTGPAARRDAASRGCIDAGIHHRCRSHHRGQEGSGHVRIAGQFKGDVNVQGNLTIEAGAHLTGGVKADTVVVGGQLDGNIDAASRVELLQTGVLNGELKAGSLTVAAGSRMRGKAEFGWDEKPKH